MPSERLEVYSSAARQDLAEERAVAAGRRPSPPEFTPGGRPPRLLWCRLKTGSPGDPPDERYYADEVLPDGLDGGGHLVWATPPGGLQDLVVHNVAEAAGGTQLLAEGRIVRVEERLDGSAPPEFVYLAAAEAVPARRRLARIESYSSGAYTVQPVVRGAGGFVDDGPQIGDVVNLGEIQADEQGYLDGPAAADRYVHIFETPAGWTIVLHPPRMV